MGTLLAESSYCRLCANESEVGYNIFDDSEDKASLAMLINKYLPIKVVDNGQLPVRICKHCHMGVAATIDLIDRMMEGQQKLRTLLQREAAPANIQSALINLQGDTADIPMDDLGKGAEASKVFAENHPMSFVVDGRQPPKRKRGRPRKGERPPKPRPPKPKVNEESILEELFSDVPRRSNRRASLPRRQYSSKFMVRSSLPVAGPPDPHTARSPHRQIWLGNVSSPSPTQQHQGPASQGSAPTNNNPTKSDLGVRTAINSQDNEIRDSQGEVDGNSAGLPELQP